MPKIFVILILFSLITISKCFAFNALDENAKFANDLNFTSNEQFRQNQKHILYYKGSSDFYLRGTKKSYKKKFNKIDVRIKVNNKMSQPLDYDLKHNQTAE